MNRALSSYSTIRSQSIADFFLPGWGRLAVYCLVSIAILAGLNYPVFVELFSGATTQDIVALISIDRLTFIQSKALEGINTIAVYAFWLVIAGAGFAITWFIYNVAYDVNVTDQEVSISDTRRTKLSRKVHTFLKYTACVACSVGIVGFLYLVGQIILPSLGRHAVGWVADSANWRAYALLVGAVLGVMACLHVLSLLGRIFRYIVASIGMS